jgi:carbonyl reductase 1
MKSVFVTGGNSGIGLALCRQLVVEHGCRVFMGSRSLERGAAGLKSIIDAHPDKAEHIEVIQIDVGDDTSVAAAADVMKNKGITLYALVNNAGVGLNATGEVLPTNFYGPKRVSDAFLHLVSSRIVNVSSGSASGWLRNQNDATKSLFSSADTTWEELDAAVQAAAPNASMGGYGLSKAGLTAYTIQQAKQNPSLLCTSLSPGFIQTKMTDGFGAKLTPEQGTVSLIRCLFGEVTSGFYYGSDGLRSPITVTRDPGTPEYEGEENPDPSKYNN